MSGQLAIPVEVRADEIAREKSLGGAIELCAKVAGYELDKQLGQELGVDKAQFSRWTSNTEGILWPKLKRLMDKCGNHAPVFWMLHDLGYDVTSIRKKESELERENRLKDERINELEKENRVLRSVFRESVSA